jgi:hypothetical protein
MFESLVDAASPHVGECWQLTDEQLLQELAGTEAEFRRVYARSLELIGEAQARDLSARVGYPNLPNLLQAVLRVSRAEARQRIASTAVLRGETGDAARSGVVGSEHIGVIHKTLQVIAPHTSVGEQQDAENILVHAAVTLDPAALAGLGREIVARMDQDGRPPTETEPTQPQREFRSRTKSDGTITFSGHLDAETGALLGAVLDPLAAPYPADKAGPDLRDISERYGDAFADMVRLAAGSAQLPTAAGERAHVAVTVPLEVLKTRVGQARLTEGGYLSAAQARLLACDAKVLPVVLGSHSEPLDVGRLSYTVPQPLRRALAVRDQGCAFPDCSRPVRQCDAHHIKHWADGGHTALDNLVLLCSRHHRLLHRSQWTVEIVHGHPVFRPPAWLDRQRQPRWNLLHTPLADTG